MGLLDEYNIDLEDVNEAGYGKKLPDDWYEGVVGSIHIQNGSKNNPDASWYIITYILEPDNDEYGELFTLPEDPNSPTPQEIDKLGFLKRRLKDLGVVDGKFSNIDEDELIGTRVKFELVTTKGKKGTKNEDKEYQNVRNLSMLEGDEEPAAAPVAAAKPRTRAAKPVVEAEEPEEETETPAPKAARRAPSAAKAAKTAVDNPFA